MKTSLLSTVIMLSFLISARGNTYYSINNSNPNSTNSWRTNRNGTGSTPSNFNGGDIFVVQAGHTLTTTANWSIGGNDSKIIIENGAILKANHKITVDIFQALDGGKYVHNDNTALIPGSEERILASNSTVEVNDWNGNNKLPAGTVWGNLIIDIPVHGSNLNQGGDLTDVAGDLIIRATGNATKEFRLATDQDYTLTIGGDLIIEGGILEASSANGNADQKIILNGSFIQSGGTFTRSNNNSNVLEFEFNGTNSNFTRTGGTFTSSYINWKVNTSKQLTLNNDFPVGLLRSFTVSGTLDVSNRSITGSGSFVLNASGKLITSNALGIGGNLSITGLLSLLNGASYEFRTATTTPFPSLLLSVNATNIVVAADVTFNKNTTITGTLTLNGGKAIIPVNTTVTVSSGNAVAGSGFDATKHIVTQVNSTTGAKAYFRVQNLTGTKSIPLGNGTYYLPVTLTTSSANDFSVCAFNGLTMNGQPNGVAFTATQKKTCVDAVWHVNRNSGTGDVMMQLAWPAALEGSSFQNLGNSQIGIAHYGTYWETAFGTGNQAMNTATRSAIVNFSPFGVGQSSIPLPLKFGDIKVLQKNNSVQIDWYSYSETNLDHYEVERSTDGTNFSTIGQVACAGNSSSRKDYTWKDNINTDGIFFYRIKAVDIDSRVVYSPAVRININQQLQAEMILYPNPVTSKRITMQAGNLPKAEYTLMIYDQQGSRVYRQDFDHQGGAISQQISLPSSLAAGIYTLSVSNGRDIKMTKSFILK